MATSTTARGGRRIGRIAAVGAVALVLAGTAAAPSAAMTRSEMARTVHGHHHMCYELGGQSFVYDFGGVVSMGCLYGDGSYYADDSTYD